MRAHVPDTLSRLRDQALLLVGFGGALCRSELVALMLEDVALRPGRLRDRYFRGSKMDQARASQKVAIALGQTPETCPVRNLRAWLLAGRISYGPLFRGVNRWGHVQAAALTDQIVALQVKKYVQGAGLDAALFSGHSLRAGLATSAALAGATERTDWQELRPKRRIAGKGLLGTKL